MHRNVSDDPIRRRTHLVVVQLHFLLLHLLLQSLHLRRDRIVIRLRVVKILLARDARRKELLRPFKLNLSQPQIRLLRHQRRRLAVQRSFLLQRIDLQQRRPRIHLVARLYKYFCNLPFHLRIDHRRLPRLQH